MRFRIVRLWAAVALTLATAVPAAAQGTGQIRGTVTDSVAGQPLAGAVVSARGHSTLVRDDGSFVLTGVPAGTVRLRVQRLGYSPAQQTVTVSAGGTATANFRLIPAAVALQSVVAVGYGTERREQVTSAVSSVNAADFVQAPPRTAASLIQGKVAGLIVTTPSGDPTSGTEVMLRGIPTIEGSRSPLVLIDGIPGDLNTVSPKDIASISVLKDASAAAIYGSRASNGVILITTKKYSGGQPSIRYDGYADVQAIAKRPDFLTASDYRRLIQQGYAFQDMGYNTNWENQVLRQPVSSRNTLSITGGSATNSYNGSLDFENTQGIFDRSDNKSITGRIALDQRMYDQKLETNFELLSRIHDNFAGPSYAYAWRQALIRNPTDRVRDTTGAIQERSGYFYDNPVGIINTENGQNEDRDLRMHGTVTLRPFEGLSLSLMGGTERTDAQYGDATTFQNTATTKSGLDGTAYRSASSTTDHIVEGTGTYNGSLGRQDYTLLGGYSYEDFENDGFSAYNYGFPTDLFGYNALEQGSALAAGQASMNSGKSSYKLIGFFGRLNYSWADRFLVMGSVRYEGNSRFGANHKWGLFPAVSAGWQLGNEQFIKNRFHWIDELKLRVGYGVTGIAPSASYLSLTSYGYGAKFLYNGTWVQGLSPVRNPNPDLRWEQKSEINTGVDFALFRSRLTGSFDVYRSDNRDMLYNYSVPVPPNLYGSILANVGHMRNNGFELSLSYDVVRRRNFTWTTSGNWSTNANRLMSLSNAAYQTADFFNTGYTGEPVQQSTHRVQVGQPIGNFWGWKSVDIDSTGAWIVLDSAGNRISIRDAKEKDKRVLGNGLPKDYVAWNNTVRYGRFDLNVNMRGAFRFQILNFQRMFYENPTILQYNMLKSAFNKVYGKRLLHYDLAYVSYYLENGDYWKVDNVTLGYTLPARMLGRAASAISSARVYLSGSNLLTLTGYKGMDPEVTTLGSSDNLSPGDDNRDTYPTTRTFTFGLSLKF
ncbi:MAG: SusC/RagA family TonB-linked outer membrane protein [Gemmatimonadota bacterium]|nr:SusC/RagA family TonB-linked outer membrane protein [Gemmatimonadota bacterium]HEU4990453.1 SusC/RagA family TonB-linked outer membrane protein [Gemmatimonadaceae bacterium]